MAEELLRRCEVPPPFPSTRTGIEFQSRKTLRAVAWPGGPGPVSDPCHAELRSRERDAAPSGCAAATLWSVWPARGFSIPRACSDAGAYKAAVRRPFRRAKFSCYLIVLACASFCASLARSTTFVLAPCGRSKNG